jgi:serine/tyrosine/threonine adenylyltransferase
VVAEWNLTRLAEALLPLFDDDEERAVALAQDALGAFRQQYSAAWLAGMKAKLGLDSSIADDVASPLIDEVLGILQDGRVDYTSFFRRLGAAARGKDESARNLFPEPDAFLAWARRWQALNPDAEMMDRVNPAYVPRNHLVEEALDAATDGDLEPLRRLLEAVTDPYRERPGVERYAGAAPESFGPYRTFCGT